jgi:hypothetical protein
VAAAVDDPRRLMVFVTLHDRSFGRSTMLDDMVPRCSFGAASTSAVRGCERCAAERDAGDRCNHKSFQEFVHGAPSLSLSGFMRAFFAAYDRVGKMGFIF